jgi:hypothetical protein
MYWEEKPFNPGWSLGDIPDIQRGKVPSGLFPQSDADLMAIKFLKRLWAPPLKAELVADGAARLQKRLPWNKLCAALAIMARPYIVRERPTSFEMYAAQNLGLCKYLQRMLGSADRDSMIAGESLYALIAKRQLELIYCWPVPCPDDAVSLAVPDGDLMRWQCTMLTVALMEQAYFFVELVSPQNLPDRAIDYVVGKTLKPDWYLAGQASLATVRGDLEMMESFRKAAKLPAHAKQLSHIRGDNPDDRDMKFPLGEALVECDASGARRWESAEKPWPFLKKVATRKNEKSQQEDDSEIMAGREAAEDLGLGPAGEFSFTPAEDMKDQPAAVATDGLPVADILNWQTAINGLPAVFDKDAILRVLAAKEKGEAISKSDRAKFDRAKAALKTELARQAVYRGDAAATRVSAANASVYQEKFPRLDGADHAWAHLFNTPGKLDALKAVLAESRPPVIDQPQDPETLKKD